MKPPMMPMMEDKGSAPPPFIKGKKDMGRKTTKKGGRGGGRSGCR